MFLMQNYHSASEDFSKNKISILYGFIFFLSYSEENQASKNTPSGNDEIVVHDHSAKHC